MDATRPRKGQAEQNYEVDLPAKNSVCLLAYFIHTKLRRLASRPRAAPRQPDYLQMGITWDLARRPGS